MELREYWSIIRRRWWLPVAVMLVALVAATAVGVRGAAAYKTDMRIAISTIPTPDPNATLYYDPTYYSNLDSEYLADDMSEFMTSRAFADAAGVFGRDPQRRVEHDDLMGTWGQVGGGPRREEIWNVFAEQQF